MFNARPVRQSVSQLISQPFCQVASSSWKLVKKSLNSKQTQQNWNAKKKSFTTPVVPVGLTGLRNRSWADHNKNNHNDNVYNINLNLNNCNQSI